MITSVEYVVSRRLRRVRGVGIPSLEGPSISDGGPGENDWLNPEDGQSWTNPEDGEAWTVAG